MGKVIKNKHNDSSLKICCGIFIILTLIFASLFISLNIKNNSLKEKASELDEIIIYQKESLDYIAKAEEIQINLDDYAEKWGDSEIGSTVEQRAIDRYKEELDKFELIIGENNKFIRDNEDLLSNYLGINAEESVSSNNLLYTFYEDDYFFMLDYTEE